MTIRPPLRLLAATIAATALGACGSKSSDEPGTCERAPVPTTGPGDAFSYFPAELGRTWTYDIEGTGATDLVRVDSMTVAGNETVWQFTSVASNDPATLNIEPVVKRPAGVYVLTDPSVTPPLDKVYPTLVLPFPVAVTPKTLQIQCTNLDVGDLDGDGRGDRAYIVGYLQVLSVTETAQVGAGSFVDVAHVQTTATVSIRASSYGTVTADATEDDWYAKGVGRVVSLLSLAVDGGPPSMQTESLLSYTVPAAVAAPHPSASRAESGAASSPVPASPEAAAIAMARHVATGR